MRRHKIATRPARYGIHVRFGSSGIIKSISKHANLRLWYEAPHWRLAKLPRTHSLAGGIFEMRSLELHLYVSFGQRAHLLLLHFGSLGPVAALKSEL